MWYLSRLEWNKGVNPAVIRMKNIPEQEKRKYRVPETGGFLMCFEEPWEGQLEQSKRSEGSETLLEPSLLCINHPHLLQNDLIIHGFQIFRRLINSIPILLKIKLEKILNHHMFWFRQSAYTIAALIIVSFSLAACHVMPSCGQLKS